MNGTEKARQTLRSMAEEQRAAKAAKAAKRAEVRGRTPLALAYLMMAATFAVAAWSAYHLVAAIPGVPTLYAVLAFAAVEGAWVVCTVLMVMWQNDVAKLYRFNKANNLAKKIYWVSLALNFAHGFVLVGDVIGGALAGLVLCIFPYVFKELFGVTVANRVEELRHLGLGDVLAEQYKVSALARFHEHEQPPSRGEHHPEQLASSPEHTASSEHEHPSSPEQPARPLLVPVEQPASTPPVTGHEQPSKPLASASTAPSMAELARELLAQGASKDVAAARIQEAIPTAKAASVKAEIRRQARKLEQQASGPYL
ncbi:hypothetical protein FNQ90_02475 [Streptomyces alkaliphilus]|uniref:Uncharacterized protein n=1 Tax=Streptomyces alkaliphilus TaxID=1472722 RepID=A0A7W3TA14_9ACTN|nr:hypothetical protein [Streptomyces alkaliphilus]MBB0243001.1 hypothetical protein [Streptomyces alkaliphilus]